MVQHLIPIKIVQRNCFHRIFFTSEGEKKTYEVLHADDSLVGRLGAVDDESAGDELLALSGLVHLGGSFDLLLDDFVRHINP